MKAEAPRQVARTNSTNAPVNVCVFKISDCAGDLWSSYRESNPPQKLFQIQARVANKKANTNTQRAMHRQRSCAQVDHDARPSVSVNIRRALEDLSAP